MFPCEKFETVKNKMLPATREACGFTALTLREKCPYSGLYFPAFGLNTERYSERYSV